MLLLRIRLPGIKIAFKLTFRVLTYILNFPSPLLHIFFFKKMSCILCILSTSPFSWRGNTSLFKIWTSPCIYTQISCISGSIKNQIVGLVLQQICYIKMKIHVNQSSLWKKLFPFCHIEIMLA